jgi:hypothetical protein
MSAADANPAAVTDRSMAAPAERSEVWRSMTIHFKHGERRTVIRQLIPRE